MKPHRFLPEAADEFFEQIAHYDRLAASRGDKFVAEVEAIVRDIRTHPESGAVIYRSNVRKRVLRVHPYNVLYVNEPDEIVIVAIAPHSRRPGYWRKRLRRR